MWYSWVKTVCNNCTHRQLCTNIYDICPWQNYFSLVYNIFSILRSIVLPTSAKQIGLYLCIKLRFAFKTLEMASNPVVSEISLLLLFLVLLSSKIYIEYVVASKKEKAFCMWRPQ